MNNKYYVGKRAKSITIGKEQPPISRVILNGDNDASFIVGDDSGQTLETFVPTATEQMAQDILAKVQGFKYQGYTVNNAYIAPEVELGDGITVGGVYGVLASREFSFTPKMTEQLGAPYETEEDHEYHYEGNYAKDIKNKVQLGQLYYGTRISRKNGIEIVKTDGSVEKSRVTLNSDTLAFYNDNGQEALYYDAPSGVFRLTQYANVEDALDGSQAFSRLELTTQQLQLDIDDAKGNISSLQLTASSLQTQITNIDNDVYSLQITANSLSSTINSVSGSVSSVQQSLDSISLGVSNGSESSTMYLYKDGYVVSSANIQITGMVTFSDLSGTGTSTINGANITTGTINAAYVNVSNQFSVGQSNYYGGFTSYGYLGCGYGSADYIPTYGIMMSSSNGSNYVITTSEGSRMQGGGSYMFVTSGGCYASSEIAIRSDRRLKSNISYDLEVYKELLRELKPCKFHIKDEVDQGYHLGFIAQEVEESLNSLALQGDNFEGLIHDENDRYFLRYGEFIAGAIALIQELDNRVKELEGKL